MDPLSSPDRVAPKVMRAAGMIAVASILGYVVSFVKAAMVAAYLGTGRQMDAFLWSLALVNLFATVASTPLTAVLVPVYLSLKVRDSSLARVFIDAILGLLLLAFSVLSLLLAAGAPLVAKWLGSDLGQEGIGLTARLVWLMVPVVLFSGGWTACQAVLNAEKSFFLPALSAAFPALLVIPALVLAGPGRAVYAQAVGLSLGALLQWATLLLALRRKGLGRRWTLNLHTEGMPQFFKLLWPLLGTQVFILCLPVVDRTMAARFSPGSISALGYAQTLMNISATVFLTALHTAIFPFLSQQVVEDGLAALKQTFVPAIRTLIILLAPVSILLVVLQKPVIRLVFERGAFDAQATALTTPAFGAYMIGVVPMAITFFCSRGFSALQDSKTNALVGVLGLVSVKLLMNVVLTRTYGYLGLAMATSAAYATTAVVMLWLMRRKLGGIGGRRLLLALAKTLVASSLASLLAWYGVNGVTDNPVCQLLAGGTAGVLGYILAAYLLRLEDVRGLSIRLVHSVHARGRAALQGVVGQ